MTALRPSRLQVMVLAAAAAAAAACDDNGPRETAAPGVVFAFPVDGQLDVPTSARLVVTFSDEVDAGALGACDAEGRGGFCLVGPDGAVDAAPAVVGDGRSVELLPGPLAPGATYQLFVGQALAPFAQNLPAAGPLVRFTTRAGRPRSGAPTLIAINGSAPAKLADPGARPLFETSTIQLVFSEPLDERTVFAGPGSVELVTGGAPVAATVLAEGVHVSIDPKEDLTAGATYQLRLGNQITDLEGQVLSQLPVSLVPQRSRAASGANQQVLRTRLPGDPGPKASRAGAEPNVILLDKPLIGRESVRLEASALTAELGDPQALGGPIAFTIRRGQRLRASGLDVKLGGQIPAGLATGELQIELLTDGGGRMYRNPYQAPGQRPENARAPLYVDLTLDLAVYATDPLGNAVLSQTVLGVQAAGTAIPTQGVLAIETVASIDLGLLGVTSAPSNLVLELITAPGEAVPADAQAPALVATYPAAGAKNMPVTGGVDLVFDEPVDIDRLRAGGVRLETSGGAAVPAAVESHGAAVVVRPLASLAYGTDYRVLLSDVADLPGNRMAETAMLQFSTPQLAATSAPMMVVAISPGAPCALTGATATSPGRCSGGAAGDDLYQPFTLAADQPIDVELSRPLARASAVLGTACGTGSVRVEQLSAGGGCTGVVPGALVVRERGLAFYPDQPWAVGGRYRFALVSGNNETCDAGELCGTNGVAANLDPLANVARSGAGGGPSLVVDFTGAEAGDATPMIAQASPWTDVNGSGTIDAGEVLRDENRALMRITGTTGNVTSASFTSPDCDPATPEKEACMYLLGALPVALGALTTDCPLPGGLSAPQCVPVAMTPQTMYATSIAMHAVVTATGISINVDADTGTSLMRIREPASGPLTGYIIDDGGKPKLVAALDLYMDAPDMQLPLSTHDLHSKPLSAALEGPVSFLPDGRIAIAASNTADLPVEVLINAPLGISGTVKMVVPQGQMKLQLVSAPIRGGAR